MMFSGKIHWKTSSEKTEKIICIGSYHAIFENIRENIGSGPVWVSIDESTNVDNR